MNSGEFDIPDARLLPSVKELCSIDRPYENYHLLDELFLKAMKEIILWHQESCDFYAQLLKSRGFHPRELSHIDDLGKIPTIWANFFKKHEILTIPRDQVFLHLTSSGTTGQKSQIFFDPWSIKIAQRMVDSIFSYYGWANAGRCNYLLYSYEPSEAHALGTSYTDNYLCKYAPAVKVQYALREKKQGEYKFDLWGCISALEQFSASGLPVRIFGFPAFLYFTVEQLREKNMRFQFPASSLIFLGGGWKGYQGQAVDKREFYALVQEYLGIPDDRIRDGFGSVEHCIPYVECPKHHFHVPVWSRVLVRDVETMNPLPWGQSGFLNLISPYITSVPANSVVMGDLATLYPPSECSCGLDTPFFEILGRAGTSKNRSCALAAAELLKEYS
jgi:hypothetical protein